MKLFIIGNGFDQAHKLKTSYEDFRRYLQKSHPNANPKRFTMPNVFQTPDGGVGIDDDDAAGFIMRIISLTEGDDWKDIETTLGVLDFYECFDWIEYPRDSDGDIDLWKQARLNENISTDLIVAMTKIKEYFLDWVSTIHVSAEVEKSRDFADLVNVDKDLFLSFNYTETLELVYGIKNVCHIHGKKGEEIVFGHGNSADYSDEYMQKFIGAEECLERICSNLRKDTFGAMERNKWFFDSISSKIEDIYSFGFSFSDVDTLYIRKICENLKGYNITWHLNDYDCKSERIEFVKTLRGCGYKGKFSTYSIKR